MNKIAEKILDAESNFNFDEAEKIANVIGTHYHWSNGKVASRDELQTMLGVNVSQALTTLRKNFESGNPTKQIAVSSGGFSVRVDFFNQENPSVNIYFGIVSSIL